MDDCKAYNEVAKISSRAHGSGVEQITRRDIIHDLRLRFWPER